MSSSSHLPTDGGLSADLKHSVLARRGLFVALGVIGLGAIAANLAWKAAQAKMHKLPQYQVTASSVILTPQPAWIRTDVKTEALQNSGILSPAAETLSILDPPERLEQRLATAFDFHPWIKRVAAIQKSPPNMLSIAVEYRRPVAAVHSQSALTPIDEEAFVLPSGDLDPVELGYLPRINMRPLADSSEGDSPRAGQVWDSLAIRGSLALIVHLGESWSNLHLLDITPSKNLEVRGDLRFPIFELRTKGGTHISWGAAPGFGPESESPFAEKLARLNGFVAQNGSLGSVNNSPKWIDVRNGLKIEPRVAKDTPTQTAQGPSEEVKK